MNDEEWTILWNDGDDDQYSYVHAADLEDVTARMVVEGTQSQSEQWRFCTIGEFDDYQLDEPYGEHIMVIATIPGHVAVNFP